MSLARAVSPLRATMRSTPMASSSRRTLVTRSPTSDRYLTIHAFFTRQSPAPALPRDSVRSQLGQRRWNSSQKQCANCDSKSNASASASTPPVPKARKDHAQDYAPFIRRLIASSSVIKQGSPHRPTKEELLGAASGWWQRLRIRIKWFTIRGWRRFNMDDLSAFASWFVVGNSESTISGHARPWVASG
jgi:distribution and morphology protein 31